MPKTDTCKKCDIFSVLVKTENGNLESIERESGENIMALLKLLEITWIGRVIDQARTWQGFSFCFRFAENKTTSISDNKRQLSVNNCGIHDCGSDKGYFRMWIEATTSRGPAEISSCIWHFAEFFETFAKGICCLFRLMRRPKQEYYFCLVLDVCYSGDEYRMHWSHIFGKWSLLYVMWWGFLCWWEGKKETRTRLHTIRVDINC